MKLERERDRLTEMSFSQKSRHSVWPLSSLNSDIYGNYHQMNKTGEGKKILLPGKLTLSNINHCED